MKRLSLNKSSIITAAFLALAPAMAFADVGNVYISGTNPASIKVKSNGQAYTQLDYLGNFSIIGRLNFDTGVAGRVKSWRAEPVITNGYGIASIIPGMSSYRQSQSYSAGSRPKKIGKNLVFSIPSSKIKDAAVSMCNWQASVLRDQGKSNKQIFGQDRYVSFDITMSYSIDSNGAGSGSQIFQGWAPYEFKVQCNKWQGSQIPSAGDLKAPLQVSKATMQLKEIVTLGGACKVDTTTAIVASEASATVKYRFVHSSGKKSKVFTVKTKGNKIAVVRHEWDIPNKPGIEQGWVQIVGVAPGFNSNKAQYSMRCKAKAPGGFAPNPKKPKVRIPLGGNGTLNN